EEGLVGMRYRLLETIREYGSEQLHAAGEATARRDCHLAWYSALAQRMEAGLLGPEQLTHYRRHQQEEANLRAALDWIERSGQTDGPGDGMSSEERLELGLCLAGSLWQFWHMRGRLAEGHGLLSRVLAHSGPRWQSIGRAKALVALGYLDFARGDLGEAQLCCADALALARALDHAPTLLMALWGSGVLAMAHGDLDAAERYLADQQATASELGSRFALTAAICWQGELAWLR